MAIYYFLKKSSYFFLFILWGSSSFASVTDIVDIDEKKQNNSKSLNYSAESKVLYHQALQFGRSNNLDDFETSLKQSAEKGHLGAAYTLGNYYHLTLGEKEKALEWYTFVHNSGYPGMTQILDSLMSEITINATEQKYIKAQVNSKKIKHKIKLYKAQKENKKYSKKFQDEKSFKKSLNRKFFD